MEVRALHDPAAFLAATRDLLLADEARHNLMLGIAGTLRDDSRIYAEHRLWLVERDGRVHLAALQTPPYNLVLSRPHDAHALAALAEALAADEVQLPGVTAALPEGDGFAEAWAARTGVAIRKRTAQRIYRVSRVRPVSGVSGQPRAAGRADRDLLVEWLSAFADEALPSDAAGRDVAVVIDARLASGRGGFALWEDDGRPVSLVGWGAETPNGARIGPVYTPPDDRGRGYASALTAAVSADRLASGRSFCFLYTDLANPTSNRIYVDIGYEPVCDSCDYAFDPRDPA